MIGFGETAAGLGLMVGPILGGFLNTAFGYFYCYAILSGFLAISALFVFIVMPNSMNNSGKGPNEELTEEEKLERAQEEEEFDKISQIAKQQV